MDKQQAVPVDRSRTDAQVSVIIPTLGRDILTRCLDALEAGTMWPAQVIVVDQGRRDEVAQMLAAVAARSFDTLWIPSVKTNKASGVNEGLERVSTPFVAITDDDCLVQHDWIERIGIRLRRDPAVMITGKVLTEGDGAMYATMAETEMVQRHPSLRFDRLSGGNMAVATDILRRLGGLDDHESVHAAEDVELAYRTLRAGVALVYAPDLVITHVGWRDEAQRLERYRTYAHSQGAFLGKYLRRGDVFIACRILISLTRALRRWARGVATGRKDLAQNGRAYVSGLLPGIAAGWRRGLA